MNTGSRGWGLEIGRTGNEGKRVALKSHKELDVWNKAMELVVKVYCLMGQHLDIG